MSIDDSITQASVDIFLRNYIPVLGIDIALMNEDRHPKVLVDLYKRAIEKVTEAKNSSDVNFDNLRLTLEEYHQVKSFYIEKDDRESFRIFITSVMWMNALPEDFDDWDLTFQGSLTEYTVREFFNKWINK